MMFDTVIVIYLGAFNIKSPDTEGKWKKGESCYQNKQKQPLY